MQEPTQPINLNISDIADLIKIIDYAFEEGAFKGLNNIRQILSTRDRVDLVISAINASVTQNTQDNINSFASELTESEVNS